MGLTNHSSSSICIPRQDLIPRPATAAAYAKPVILLYMQLALSAQLLKCRLFYFQTFFQDYMY